MFFMHTLLIRLPLLSFNRKPAHSARKSSFPQQNHNVSSVKTGEKTMLSYATAVEQMRKAGINFNTPFCPMTHPSMMIRRSERLLQYKKATEPETVAIKQKKSPRNRPSMTIRGAKPKLQDKKAAEPDAVAIKLTKSQPISRKCQSRKKSRKLMKSPTFLQSMSIRLA